MTHQNKLNLYVDLSYKKMLKPPKSRGTADVLHASIAGSCQPPYPLNFFYDSPSRRDWDSPALSPSQNSIADATEDQSRIPSKNEEQTKVAILLATYQGQHYLAEQLDSFVSQTHQNWEVWASDDGSSDNTYAILECYQKHWPIGRMFIQNALTKGFALNFLSLTCQASISADYYAYADQDDIWNADKLERAVTWLKAIPSDIPALYCSRTTLVDKHNIEIDLSPLFMKQPSFANALMQNIGGGNTMVFNNAARELLREAGQCIPVVTHDWWAYMLVSGCGGRVFYDATQTLRYRQHENNLVGMNSSWTSRIKRIHMLWQGCFKQWNDINIIALKSMQLKLTPDNFRTLEQFAAARQMSLTARLFHLRKSGIYRQTLLGNLGLIAAAIFGKL